MAETRAVKFCTLVRQVTV